jgi:orotate phosphoribosyltransferase
MYGTKGVSGGKRRVTLPVEFHRLIRQGTKVLVVEDLVSSGATVRLLTELVESLGGKIIGVGALWRRTKRSDVDGKSIFSLVSRDFPTYPPEDCPLCKKGMPLNREFVKRRDERKPSTAEEDDE